MKYLQLNNEGIKKNTSNYFISYVFAPNKYQINIRSKSNFEINKTFFVSRYTSFHCDINGKLILGIKNKGYIDINLENFELIEHTTNYNLRYKWENGAVLYFDYYDNKFKIIHNNDISLIYNKRENYSNKWMNSGILEFYSREKTNNWLRCLDPNGGKEKWRIEYPGSISAADEYNDVLILEYHEYPLHTKPGFEGKPNFFSPVKYVIVIDSFTGKQIWRAQFKFRMRIDRNAGVVLQGGHEVIEWDIETGKEKNRVKIITDDIHGHFLRFSNFNGYYYTLHKGSFGKINKKSGSIEWEFDLLDAKGEKRKLSDWILLGNGKLVLKAMPNHPNGDLMCIFDPDENMEFANIVHGEKLK